jgi:anti-sigma factor RsiW
MARCDGRLEQVSALLDGELDGEDELELRRHLDVCDVCTAWRMQLEALSASVAASLGRERAPRSLAHRVDRLAVGTAPGTRVLVTLAGVAAVATLSWLGLTLLRPVPDFEKALLRDHQRLVAGGVALAVPSSDPSEVARRLGELLPFGIAVEAVEGARLRGGHACTLQGLRAAYLQYERGGEPVSVFLYPRQSPRRGVAASRDGSCRALGETSLCAFEGADEIITVVASSPVAARDFRDAAQMSRP